jgi:hypothetical protein
MTILFVLASLRAIHVPKNVSRICEFQQFLLDAVLERRAHAVDPNAPPEWAQAGLDAAAVLWGNMITVELRPFTSASGAWRRRMQSHSSAYPG